MRRRVSGRGCKQLSGEQCEESSSSGTGSKFEEGDKWEEGCSGRRMQAVGSSERVDQWEESGAEGEWDSMRRVGK